MNPRFVEAELKIWRKVEDLVYAEGKHPDEVYVDLLTCLANFYDKKYPIRNTLPKNQLENKLRNQQVEK